MNQKKRFSDRPWVAGEMRALRAEEPKAEAVERAVRIMQAPPPRRQARSAWVWRTTALAGAAGVMAIVFVVRPQQASAASIKQIADAVRAQVSRHERVYRLDAEGKQALMLETWIAGEKFRTVDYSGDDPRSIVGYDGKLQFRWSPKGGGFVDDVEPTSSPVESIDDYLDSAGNTVVKQQSGVELNGRTADLYVLQYSNVVFDLYADPVSRLPIEREVHDRAGRFIERNDYDYPGDIPESTFEPPSDPGVKLTDFPALRQEAARRLRGPGQRQVVAGVAVTLRAVLVGPRGLLAVWTGGAPPEVRPGAQSGDQTISVKGVTAASSDRYPVPQTALVTTCAAPANSQTSPVFPAGGPFYCQIAWFNGTAEHSRAITVEIPVCAQDLTRPLRDNNGRVVGFRSKLVGRARFTVTNPIVADDAQRVLWKPAGEVRETQSAK